MVRSGNRRAFGRSGALIPQSFANLEAWYRFGAGITVATGVSVWADQSGKSGRNLLQATGANQPALQSDGSILFDGIAHFLKTAAFTLNQPNTVYLRFRQVTWTNNDKITDGVSGSSLIFQGGGSPQIFLNAGVVNNGDGNLAVNTYGSVAAVFNGASSVIQVNTNAPTSTNAGTNNAGGFTLGAASNGTAPGNIQVKEVIIYSAAHDATTRATIIAYLSTL